MALATVGASSWRTVPAFQAAGAVRRGNQSRVVDQDRRNGRGITSPSHLANPMACTKGRLAISTPFAFQDSAPSWRTLRTGAPWIGVMSAHDAGAFSLIPHPNGRRDDARIRRSNSIPASTASDKRGLSRRADNRSSDGHHWLGSDRTVNDPIPLAYSDTAGENGV
jgi:hypothetical protein